MVGGEVEVGVREGCGCGRGEGWEMGVVGTGDWD